MSSRREGQDNYLDHAITTGMDDILRGLKEIVRTTDAKQKYYHLLNVLSDLGLIQLDGLKSKMYPKVVSGVVKLIDDISILKTPALEVVYVQPRKSKEDKPDDKHHYIYFDEFANCVESHGDMGGLFAGYLRKWEKDPAEQPPRKP